MSSATKTYNTKHRHTNQSAKHHTTTNIFTRYHHSITHYTIGHRGQLNMHYHQTTYPSSPQLTYDMTTYYNKTDGHSPTTRKLTGHNSRNKQSPLSLRPPYPPTYTLPTFFFTNIIVMADKHNIPKGKMHSNWRLLPNHTISITQKTTWGEQTPVIQLSNS